jgi:2,5-diketo-D-gluconate reductase A
VSNVPTTALNNGVAMPQLGFGVFQVPPEDAERAVSAALEAGYRSIDTAAAYRNEQGVGRALAASGVPRDELFVTTKLWNADHGKDKAPAAFEASLERLGLEKVDLYLVHWPVPAQNKWIDTWHALQDVYASGRARAIGVSNFTESQLRRLFVASDVVPAVNQVELHPFFPQVSLRAFHAEHGIATEAWSPLGQGGELLDQPALVGLAKRFGVTPAQVVLRWHLQLGNVVIPKSVTPERIRSNLDVFGFELAEGDLAEVSGLDRGTRLGPDPDTFDVR